MTATATARALDPGLGDRYRADGYVIVRGVFSADRIAALAEEADRLRGRADLIDSDNIRCRWQTVAETGECRFDCFDPVIDLSPLCASTSRDPHLLAADLIVAHARQTGARVTFVEDAALLADVGGVGALLRYRL